MEESIAIKIKPVLSALKKHKWYIVAAVVLSAALLFVLSKYFITEKYTSQISLYVSNDAAISSDKIQSGDFAVSTYLARECEVLFKEHSFLRRLSEKMDGRISPSALYSAITVKHVTNTRLVKITVETPDPQLSAEICSKMTVVADEVIKDVAGPEASAKSITDLEPLPANRPSSPNIRMNTVLGAVLGAVISVGIIVLIAILDNTVRNEADIRMRLNVPVLGEIPTIQAKSRRRGRNND